MFRSLGREDPLEEENGNALQYSCLKKSHGRLVWWATIPRVTKSREWLNDLTQARGIQRKDVGNFLPFLKKTKFSFYIPSFWTILQSINIYWKLNKCQLEFYQWKTRKSNCSYGTCILVSSIYSSVNCIWHSSITLTLNFYITNSGSGTLFVY